MYFKDSQFENHVKLSLYSGYAGYYRSHRPWHSSYLSMQLLHVFSGTVGKVVSDALWKVAPDTVWRDVPGTTQKIVNTLYGEIFLVQC